MRAIPLLLLFPFLGCSVVMAVRQPPKKDLGVLQPGNPRALVLAEFGAPIHSETRDGKKVDVFAFVQGYGKAAKAGRAIFHSAADLFTLGLWEAVGTPTEMAFDGNKTVYEVVYGADDRVEQAAPLSKLRSQIQAAPAIVETEVPKQNWSTLSSTETVKVYTKAHGTLLGTLESESGEYYWIGVDAHGKQTVLKSDVEKITVLKK
jgi:hypothetical protein